MKPEQLFHEGPHLNRGNLSRSEHQLRIPALGQFQEPVCRGVVDVTAVEVPSITAAFSNVGGDTVNTDVPALEGRLCPSSGNRSASLKIRRFNCLVSADRLSVSACSAM